MLLQYYLAEDDFPRTGRWYLGAVVDHHGREIDVGIFSSGVPISLTPPIRLPIVGGKGSVEVQPPLRISLQRHGPPLDFTLGTFSLPVVTAAVADLIASIAPDACERLPAKVDGQTDVYEILNIVSHVACLDLKKSEIDWGPEVVRSNPPKPFAIFKFVIDPVLARGHIFRLAEWPGAIIVSDTLKRLLEQARVSGIRFAEV